MERDLNFDEAVQYMSGLIRFGWKLGNDRMLALAARLGNPHLRYEVIHVTGTKGKGSTTALAAGILQAQGYRVGSYFSPYVYDVRERIQVNGEPIPCGDFARLVSMIRPHIEALAETEHGQTTEFELKTMVGLVYFAERAVDFACIEVGIGGRLDATNIVHPSVTVITNIGLDHTEILGDTYAQIAGEKAGIIKAGVPCVTATREPEAFRTIAETALARSSRLIRVRRDARAQVTADGAVVGWRTDAKDEQFGPVTVATPARISSEVGRGDNRPHLDGAEAPCLPDTSSASLTDGARVYPDLALRMGGLFQRENAACAIAAVELALDRRGEALKLDAVRAALDSTALPGRLTVLPLPEGPLVILDGAHNAIAAEALAMAIASLRKSQGIRETRLVIGMVGGHSPDEVLSFLASDADLVIACAPDWRRAQPAETIAEAARRFCANVMVVDRVWDAAWQAVSDARSDALVLIAGSFYTVGEVRPDSLLEAWVAGRNR